MKKNSWTLFEWKYMINAIKRPFLFIRPAFGRYSVTQDKTPKYLKGKK